MSLAVLFDADAFNFSVAIGLIDALSDRCRSGDVTLHFVKNVEREIKGENRNRIEELRKVGAVTTHRFHANDATGKLFAKLFEKRHKTPGGPVHEGECANVAWAKTCGNGEPLVVADKGGRALAEAYGLLAFGVGELTFECLRLGFLSRNAAHACLERWQTTQGRPDPFEFEANYESFCAARG